MLPPPPPPVSLPPPLKPMRWAWAHTAPPHALPLALLHLVQFSLGWYLQPHPDSPQPAVRRHGRLHGCPPARRPPRRLLSRWGARAGVALAGLLARVRVCGCVWVGRGKEVGVKARVYPCTYGTRAQHTCTAQVCWRPVWRRAVGAGRPTAPGVLGCIATSCERGFHPPPPPPSPLPSPLGLVGTRINATSSPSSSNPLFAPTWSSSASAATAATARRQSPRRAARPSTARVAEGGTGG